MELEQIGDSLVASFLKDAGDLEIIPHHEGWQIECPSDIHKIVFIAEKDLSDPAVLKASKKVSFHVKFDSNLPGAEATLLCYQQGVEVKCLSDLNLEH